MNTSDIGHQINEEFSMKDFVLLMRRWKSLFVKYILRILFLSMIGGGLGLLYAYLSVPVYNAELKFVMRSDPTNLGAGLSSLSTLLGSGTSPGGTGSGLERVIELIGSDRIIGNAILKEAVVNEKKDLLINHYINLQGFRKTWKKDSIINNVVFPVGILFKDLSYAQRKAIKIVVSSLIGKDNSSKIIGKSFDKKSGVVTLAVKFKNEEFAIELTNAIYKEVIDFYSDQSLASTSNNVKVLTRKADSIRRELDVTRRAFAKKTDQALGLLLQQDQVDNKGLAFKENMLSLMYAEVQKNLETLRYIEASSMPSFSIIDQPYSPIRPIQKSKFLYLIFGLILSMILSFSFILLRNYFKSLIEN